MKLITRVAHSSRGRRKEKNGSHEWGRDGCEFDRDTRWRVEKEKLWGKGVVGNLSGLAPHLQKVGGVWMTVGNLSELSQLLRVLKLWIKSTGNLSSNGYRMQNRIQLNFIEGHCSRSNRGEPSDSHRDVLIWTRVLKVTRLRGVSRSKDRAELGIRMGGFTAQADTYRGVVLLW